MIEARRGLVARQSCADPGIVARTRTPGPANSRPRAGRIVAGAWLMLMSCSGDNATVELRRVAPEAGPACGAPADAETLQVTALGDFPAGEVVTVGSPLHRGTAFELTGLPGQTRVLHVNVFGDSGPRAIGKTAPFQPENLQDGDVLAVFMAPPDGICPTGPPRRVRIGPIAARAGSGVIVAGGVDSNGAAVAAIEHYDPTTGEFRVIAESLYTGLQDGLVGATATAVSAGSEAGPRVVIAGGADSGYQVYDVESGEFSAAFLLIPGRANHAAVALDDHRVFLAGGCELPLDPARLGTCQPGQLHSETTIVELEEGRFRPGPTLAVPRQGGTLLRESERTVLYIGGVDDAGQPVTAIERIDLETDGPGEMIAGPHPAGAVAALASGAVLAAFAPPGSEPAGHVFAVPPGARQPVVVPDAPLPRRGAALAALQNGRILVVGGADTDDVLVYQPARSRFRALATAGLDVRDAAAVALDDGTVLIVGGTDGSGVARTDAWIVRTDLIGPYSSGIDLSFGVESTPSVEQWVSKNPGQVEFVAERDGDVAHAVITSSGVAGGLPSDWAVIAGPRFSRARIRVVARSLGGGVAVLAGFRGADDYLALILLPGQDATVFVLERGQLSRLDCEAGTVTAELIADRDESAVIEVMLGSDEVSASIDSQILIECGDLDRLPIGLVGVGAVGSAGQAVRVDSVTVVR